MFVSVINMMQSKQVQRLSSHDVLNLDLDLVKCCLSQLSHRQSMNPESSSTATTFAVRHCAIYLQRNDLEG